jgi:hypothetical protein
MRALTAVPPPVVMATVWTSLWPSLATNEEGELSRHRKAEPRFVYRTHPKPNPVMPFHGMLNYFRAKHP